jgi:hypothetical protein
LSFKITRARYLFVRIYNAERKMESRVCLMDIGEAETDEIFKTLRALTILKRNEIAGRLASKS